MIAKNKNISEKQLSQRNFFFAPQQKKSCFIHTAAESGVTGGRQPQNYKQLQDTVNKRNKNVGNNKKLSCQTAENKKKIKKKLIIKNWRKKIKLSVSKVAR